MSFISYTFDLHLWAQCALWFIFLYCCYGLEKVISLEQAILGRLRIPQPSESLGLSEEAPSNLPNLCLPTEDVYYPAPHWTFQ